MKINFILADDKESIIKRTKAYLDKIIKNNNIDGEVVLTTNTPQDIVEYSNTHFKEMNVYILDINFDEDINGLGLARNIRQKEPYAYIIFLTAYIQFSMLTFKYKLKVFDFLIKPITYFDLEECIKALKEDSDRICSYDRPIVETSISIKSAYHEYSIVIDDIIFIESYGPKLIIHMKEGKIETYSSLKDMERNIKKLSNSFYRSHKSYIVNLKYIKEISIQKQEIIMITGDKCLIARSQKEFFKERSKNKKILRLNQ